MYESERALYLNADKTKVVEEGDPEAAYLLVAAGGKLHIEDAERYGIVERIGKQSTSHKAKSGFNGFVHAIADPFIRRVEHTVPSASKAGTPEGGDGYPSKHPELGREDFDEAHDEDPQVTKAQAKAEADAKQAAKEEADRQSAQAEQIRADEEKAREEAVAKAEAEAKKNSK